MLVRLTYLRAGIIVTAVSLVRISNYAIHCTMSIQHSAIMGQGRLVLSRSRVGSRLMARACAVDCRVS